MDTTLLFLDASDRHHTILFVFAVCLIAAWVPAAARQRNLVICALEKAVEREMQSVWA